jgi:hypothetical protein
MTGAGRRRALALGAIALALAVAVAAVVTDPPGSTQRERAAPPRRPTVRRATVRPQKSSPTIDRRDALVAARRFADAYAAWDAGHRDARTTRELARASTPALFGSLETNVARPVARPARRLPLAVSGAYRGRGGSYLVPLGLEHAAGAHIATVVVVPTLQGPRVAQLQR